MHCTRGGSQKSTFVVVESLGGDFEGARFVTKNSITAFVLNTMYNTITSEQLKMFGN